MSKKTEVIATGKGEIQCEDGTVIPVTAKYEVTTVKYQIRGRLDVDFENLKQSRELNETNLFTLKSGYPDAPILFMGVFPEEFFGLRRYCIGILTGKHVYPKNLFLLSSGTLIDCCTPTSEPPFSVEPH